MSLYGQEGLLNKLTDIVDFFKRARLASMCSATSTFVDAEGTQAEAVGLMGPGSRSGAASPTVTSSRSLLTGRRVKFPLRDAQEN
jgi:hypothetical protein